MKYIIENSISGQVLGLYAGDTPEAALDDFARGAGYKSYALLLDEVEAADAEDLVVSPATPDYLSQVPLEILRDWEARGLVEFCAEVYASRECDICDDCYADMSPREGQREFSLQKPESRACEICGCPFVSLA